MAKVRRLKKSVKFTLLIITVAIIGYALYSSGYWNGVNFSGGNRNSEIHTSLLNSSGKAVLAENGTYAITQRYQIGQDAACIQDCLSYCNEQDEELYRGYVQSWGRCLCKCRPA